MTAVSSWSPIAPCIRGCGRPAVHGAQHTGRCRECWQAELRAAWPEGAFAYPSDPRNPFQTAACRECGARCNRHTMRCWDCYKAAHTTTCKRGHDLTDPANVRIRRSEGHKACRACDAERQRAKRAARTGAEREAFLARDRERQRRARSAA